MSARHSVLIRVTHWIHAAAFVAFAVSGVAILMAHPRLYWGETGNVAEPALLEIPLPLDLDQSGWGRGLHFLAAWVTLFTGGVYVVSGILRRHFTRGMSSGLYTTAQRSAYLAVVFILFPSIFVSGLAMSPAVNAAVPIANVFGGHQSARTTHFVIAVALVVFLFLHVAMVYASGFREKMRSMISGENR